jgi:glycosyltransferase involved in cell wall biosynthesis
MSAEPAEPRLAIIVACHNDGTTIRETIDSLRGDERAELVVVDDGSTDRATLDVLSKLEGEGVTVSYKENGGPASAWMAGLELTSAPYVMPFSSDDILVQGAIAALIDALDANPDAAAAWGDLHSFGDASAYVPAAPTLCPWHVTYLSPAPGIAAFRRDSLLEVGGWQLHHGMEDWDLWMRFAARGFVGIHVPRLIFHYRRDAGGRFRGRVRRFDRFYEELRERHAELFARRRTTMRTSPAPRPLKLLFPLIDRLPLVSRLLKVQLCDLATLLFWSAGPRRTARIVLQGIAYRRRLRTRTELP